MSFLNPLLLTALAALAVPILLHLIRRRKGRTLEFPAVRYLRRTTRERARIIRLRQLVLLALRMAAIVLLVLAGARLIVPLGGRDHPPAGLVLVVDNGLTSGAVLGEGRVLDSLVARGGEALERTGARDRVWIVPAGQPWLPSVPVSPEEAREVLAALEPTHVTPDLPAQLRRAGALLDAAALEFREIVLLSDLRPEALPILDPLPERRGEALHIAPPPPTVPSNRGIAEIQVSGGLVPVAGNRAELHVRIRGNEREGAVLRAYLDDRLVASGRTGSDGSAGFALPPLPDGWAHGRVELDPDDLRGDDAGYFAFAVIAPPRVHLHPGDSPFLADAVATLEEAGRLGSAPPEEASVHLVNADLPVNPRPGSVIAIVPPGDPALLPALNRLLEELLPGWRLEAEPRVEGVERRIEGGSHISALPERPIVRHAYRIQVAEGAPQGTELLTLSDGDPWLVEASSEDHTVLLLASPLDREASDVPLSTAMVPLVDVLTSPRAAGRNPSGVAAGSPLPVPAGAHSVRAPDGTLHPLDGTSFSRTEHTGIYRFLAQDGEEISLAAVNARPPDDAPLTPEEAAARLSAGWEETRGAAAWPGSLLEGRRGREAWRWLVAVLLGVLLLEAWLAASAPGKSGSPPGVEERGARRRKRERGELTPEARNP